MKFVDVGVAPPSGVVNLANGAFRIVTAGHNATVDGVRAIGFHCPSLASGTYSTSGKLGGSQLGLVPIDVGIGQVVNWEASIPIEVPCKISGTKLNELHFFLSNEDGKSILLLDGRFEAVVVWSCDRRVTDTLEPEPELESEPEPEQP